MTGVPSIVMGLFIYTIWVIPRGVDGVTGFAGALALGCLMLPIIIRSTEEMLKLVPDHLREASVGLGRAKLGRSAGWCSRPRSRGILSGVLLAVARAAGETAPPALHDRCRHLGQLEPVQGAEHGLVDPDLQQRHAAVPGRPGSGLGRSAHPSSS